MAEGLYIPYAAAGGPASKKPIAPAMALFHPLYALRQQAVDEGLYIPSAAAGGPASKKAIAPAMALFRPPSSF